ncbi:hypothetical protein Tco_0209977 [Tanacetum coccineum]
MELDTLEMSLEPLLLNLGFENTLVWCVLERAWDSLGFTIACKTLSGQGLTLRGWHYGVRAWFNKSDKMEDLGLQGGRWHFLGLKVLMVGGFVKEWTRINAC